MPNVKRLTPPSPALDRETRAREDHHDSLRLWLKLLSCATLIENEIRQRLQADFGTTLPRFDFMAQLERCPAGLKMGELSKRLMVTGGNVTGIADMLQKEGLIVRIVEPEDRRAFRVRLTGAGQRAFKKMAIAHEEWIANLFIDIPAKHQLQLQERLKDLKTAVRSKLSIGQAVE